MFNAATLYFSGGAGKKDEALGKNILEQLLINSIRKLLNIARKMGIPKGILLKCME
ncbi:5976_t:CDS:2 [Funneliformis mosseae]|uniref:5976_t:CDS:1 n=1 Tax=Funneliformis mosseae TaxID=27381 RepID=A0A9N9FCB0_FUNMO|nr:5976_t:CDS:2 [Funneliformis mosseae]